MAVKSIATTARPAGNRKIVGTENTYRIGIGNYRIVYSVKNDVLVVQIVRVGHRKDVYNKLP